MVKKLNTMAKIPMLNGKPEIIEGMKHTFVGEFSFEIERTCPLGCSEDDSDPECEVCGGEVDDLEQIVIPWTTCKEIYQKMAQFALAVSAATELVEQSQKLGLGYEE